jgi:hypothetical protein
MPRPISTRLRYVSSKDHKKIPMYFNRLGRRVQIYSAYYADGKHYVWFVPGDDAKDIASIDL